MNLLQIPKGTSPIAERPYGTLAEAYVGADHRGRRGVWFAYARSGCGPTYLFPVLENGKISSHDGTVLSPLKEVPVYHPKDLGIKHIEWTDDKMN